MALTDSITDIGGLGEKSAQKLAQFGVYQQSHLLFHLPVRYQNKTKITPIANIVAGEFALIEAKIETLEKQNFGNRQLLCFVRDNSKRLLLRFFHWHHFQAERFIRGQRVQCYGQVLLRRRGLEMVHPQYRLLDQNQSPLLDKALTPVYPNTLGIPAHKLRGWINKALNLLQNECIEDSLATCRAGFMELSSAIKTLHKPKLTDLDAIVNRSHSAQKRLILDEFCAYSLAMQQAKIKQQQNIASAFITNKSLQQQLSNQLGFNLTNAQKRVIADIGTDLAKTRPMMRLLQGDVGCGKTAVAMFASLPIVAAKAQVVLMAPTEILAKQHFKEFRRCFATIGTNCALLVSSLNKQQRTQQLKLVADNKSGIIIGTHALFQEGVEFANLGLVIIDEQHKFGVHQRLSLAQKGDQVPHQLIMTATPIPRSLMMSLYANLDTSIIDELPPGRQATTTITVSVGRIAEIINKIKQMASQKQQTYWVCTLIDDSEALRAQSAQTRFDELSTALLGLNIALIHSKLDKKDKAQIMQQFYHKQIDVLIATTVIEVGVDAPDASLIIIEDAQRLGLAQLHQLRGRVGRNGQQGLCILLYQAPLSDTAKQRLNILRTSNDGFVIAQKDLELRGPGEMLGLSQTGLGAFKIADLIKDDDLLALSQQLMPCLLKQSESTQSALINRWYCDEAVDYGNT